jgi:hypothetical protein
MYSKDQMKETRQEGKKYLLEGGIEFIVWGGPWY